MSKNTAKVYEEIRRLNLGFFMLAKDLIKQDRVNATRMLGISESMADTIESLTPDMIFKLSNINMALCTFRFSDEVLLNLLGGYGGKDQNVLQIHAGIVAAQPQSERLMAAA